MYLLFWTLTVASLLVPCLSRAATVIFVRHAEVLQGSSNPPLSPAGRVRAKLLASMLKDAQLSAVFVSDFLRTQQTAEPVAAVFHLTPEKLSGSDTASQVAAIRQHGGTTLVVGHSNTIPAIISALGGPKVNIPETAFDNLFILTLDSASASLVRLHYGSEAPSPPAAAMQNAGMLNKGSRVMQLDFVKSGGFAGMMRNVRGTITFKDGQAEVNSGTEYTRQLAPDEASQLRAAADPAELSQFENEIKARTARSADLEHYQVTVTTDDSKTHTFDFNTSGASNELGGLPAGAVNLVRWLRQESKNILAQRGAAK